MDYDTEKLRADMVRDDLMTCEEIISMAQFLERVENGQTEHVPAEPTWDEIVESARYAQTLTTKPAVDMDNVRLLRAMLVQQLRFKASPSLTTLAGSRAGKMRLRAIADGNPRILPCKPRVR